MEVRSRIKCSGPGFDGCSCSETFKCWTFISIEVREEHDTFGSHTYSELKFSPPNKIPEGWEQDTRLANTQRFYCFYCVSAIERREEEAQRARDKLKREEAAARNKEKARLKKEALLSGKESQEPSS